MKNNTNKNNSHIQFKSSSSLLLYRILWYSFRYLRFVFCLSLLKAMKVTAAEREYLHKDQPLKE